MRWGNNALAALTAARRKGGVKWNVRAAPFRLADVTPFLLETKRNFGVWRSGGGGNAGLILHAMREGATCTLGEVLDAEEGM